MKIYTETAKRWFYVLLALLVIYGGVYVGFNQYNESVMKDTIQQSVATLPGYQSYEIVPIYDNNDFYQVKINLNDTFEGADVKSILSKVDNQIEGENIDLRNSFGSTRVIFQVVAETPQHEYTMQGAVFEDGDFEVKDKNNTSTANNSVSNTNTSSYTSTVGTTNGNESSTNSNVRDSTINSGSTATPNRTVSSSVVTSGTGPANDVYVGGYYRKNGTYVAPYHRTRPDHTTTNNYSHKGNVNPWTGKVGHSRK